MLKEKKKESPVATQTVPQNGTPMETDDTGGPSTHS